jgi:transposase InsO family protein
MQMFPYNIKNVLTDNGSEFKKYLSKLLTKNKITHYHTYPKTPKMNAHCESFNGTIQEEFVDYNVDLLFSDPTTFNEKLKDYIRKMISALTTGKKRNKKSLVNSLVFELLDQNKTLQKQIIELSKERNIIVNNTNNNQFIIFIVAAV